MVITIYLSKKKQTDNKHLLYLFIFLHLFKLYFYLIYLDNIQITTVLPILTTNGKYCDHPVTTYRHSVPIQGIMVLFRILNLLVLDQGIKIIKETENCVKYVLTSLYLWCICGERIIMVLIFVGQFYHIRHYFYIQL